MNFLRPVLSYIPGKTGLFFREQKKWKKLLEGLSFETNPIWIHAASAGEYEQAQPVIAKLKKQYPHVPIVLSFFSPSGFLTKYGKTPADAEIYFPLDTRGNIKFFLEKVQPRLALFVKYEIWPNTLELLKKKNIPAILFSAIFHEKHPALKYALLKNGLQTFQTIFVQNPESKKRLQKAGLENVEVSGDTRFDTVANLPGQSVHFPVVKNFKENKPLIIAGSTWEKDEEFLIRLAGEFRGKFKLFLLPHEPTPKHIRSITVKTGKRSVLYSRYNAGGNQADILIGDVMGMLKFVYRYADIAYIGGGFGKGIHNTLEAAVYGKPLIFGPRYHKFQEGRDLVSLGAARSIGSYEELKKAVLTWLELAGEKEKAGEKAQTYVFENTGASDKIVAALKKFIN